MVEQLLDCQNGLEKLIEKQTLELKTSERRYRDIFEYAQEGIFQSTPDGQLINANPAIASMFGCKNPEELIESIKDIPEQINMDRDRRLELVDILAHEGVVQNFDLQFVNKDGAIKYASLNIRPVRDKHGETIFYEGIVQDKTAKKEAKKALADVHYSLQEANTSLKMLLKQGDQDKKRAERKIYDTH